MQAQPAARATASLGLRPSLEAAVAAGSTLLAILAMAVDHLMGDDPGLEDPPTFLIASGLSLALAALVFRYIVPRARAAARPGRAARAGVILSAVAAVPGIAVLWLGLPFVLAGGGLALGLRERRTAPSRTATAATLLGALVLLFATAVYVAQAVGKLA
jgi:hypothetical protein